MTKSGEGVSRRTFLAAAGSAVAAGLSLAYGVRRSGAAAARSAARFDPPPIDPEAEFVQPRAAQVALYGRITDPGSPVHANPKPGDVIGFLHQHDVLPVLEMAHGEGKHPNNDLWYRFSAGWVYTANVQPIRPYRTPEEITEIKTQIKSRTGDLIPGFWGEIVVPFTTARTEPSGAPASLLDNTNMVLFYGSTFRVIEAKPDDGNNLWYKVADDRKGSDPYWILARHLRMMQPHELAPIHPGANKRIEVSLEQQRIDCYEDDQVVFSVLCSSGGAGFATPKGDHAAVYKMPSRHMYSDPETEAFSDPNYFDLPGVPFNTFITTEGHAIHGTFWHGDYGRPRSHGCLNVTPDAARWIFRWVEPATPYEELANGSSAEPGTPVRVA